MNAALYEIGQIVEYVDLISQRQTADMIMSENAKWYCAITNPNCQKRAELELYSLGFRTFAPKLRKWVSHARVRKAVERPLLNRYLFVEIDPEQQSYYAVRAVNGIEGLISAPVMTRFGVAVEPVPIPARYVESFRRRYMAGEWDFVTQEPIEYVDEYGEVLTRQNPPIPIGARVRIVEGEFDNMLATVVNLHRGKLHCKILDTNTYARLRDHGVRAA